MSTKILLIRHGETNGNTKRRYCGSLDVCLNDTGRLQAEKLLCRLKGEAVHKIYSSDRKRTIEFAKIIFKGRQIIRRANLREIDFGIFEGKSHRQIMKSHSLIYQKWLSNPYNTFVPKAESLRDFQARVNDTFKKIAFSNLGKTVAVVCHGGTISVILSAISRSKKFWELIPRPASVNVIEYKKNTAYIRLFNDTSHLEEGRNG